MNVIAIKSNPNFNRAIFEVSYDPGLRTLTVHAGEFRVGGVDYQLKEDEQVKFPVLDYRAVFYIHIVEMDSGDVRLLSDQVSDFDPPFDFAKNSIADLGTIAVVEFEANSHEPEISVYKIDDFKEEQKAEQDIIDFYKKIGLVS